MAVVSPNYSLSESCPISWPQATALMLDYPLIPQMPESVPDFVHRAYIEALWLPESIIPLSHLVHSLRRVQGTNVGEHPLRDALRPLLLPLRSIENKYQEHLPGMLHDPTAAMERETVELEENAMWYAWHHGKPSPRHFPDPDHVDEEKWKKRWMIDMERREVLVQILLHFTYLSVSPPPSHHLSPPDRSRKRKRKSLRSSPAKKKRMEASPSPPPFSAEDNLDLLMDRMAIWQATEEDTEKFLKRPGDDDRDWMRVFCEDEVRHLFIEQLPDLIRQFEEKVMPPSALDKGPDSDEEAVPDLEAKSKKARKAPLIKSTLTEADLTDGLQRGGKKNSAKQRKESDVKALVRSRSISVEPDADGRRRSRSRSVSLAAEDLKSLGGKRGGIAGNSKLFASEVDMRRQATGSTGLKRVPSTTSLSLGESAGSKQQQSSEAVKYPGTVGTTLVAETPPRPTSKQSWTLINSDHDGVPESPELIYLGSRSGKKAIPETPIKPKQGRRR